MQSTSKGVLRPFGRGSPWGGPGGVVAKLSYLVLKKALKKVIILLLAGCERVLELIN